MIHSLHVAQSGLNAAKTAVEGVMNNISNENSPGYKKRVVEFSESAHVDGRVTGRGVIIDDVKRITNEYMYDNLLKEDSKEAYYTELSNKLGDIESIFYETETSGFSNDLNRFFQSIENLRADPSNEIYKNNVKNQANIIVDDLKNLYQGIEDIQKVSKSTLTDDVKIINGILADIGKINEKIGQQIVPPNDLLDKRDGLEKELSNYVDMSIDRTEDYELRIGGLIAVRYNTNIHNLKVIEDHRAQKDKINMSANFTGFSAGDTVTYRLNNDQEFTIKHNDTVDGVNVDSVEKLMNALVYKISKTPEMSGLITAKSTTTTVPTTEHILEIESTLPGEAASFVGDILFKDASGTNSFISKDEAASTIGKDNTHIEIFDEEISLKSGNLKALTENLQTDSGLNKFSEYKTKLNNFVRTFVDVYDAFVTKSDGSYLYGEKASDIDTAGVTTEIGLFSGSTVKSFKFNESATLSYTQDKLDYLATLQWKEDLGFDGNDQNGTDPNSTSFQKFYQETHVQIASDKENNDYLKDTQGAITNAIQGSYDKLVKVDKDEELINLIKFQSAYEANAKIITVVDEMLATILGMKR